MARTVVVRPVANANLREFSRSIARRVSAASAARWVTTIGAAIARLATEADRFPQADEAGDVGLDLREMLHGRRPHVYRILFTIDGDTVNVLRVRHAAQDHLAEDEF